MLFSGKDGKTPPLFKVSGKKDSIDFADSEKGFTFAPTVRRMKGFDPEIGEGQSERDH